ncbi:tRNA (adenosine(37)-N6)-threonylcarbamoyltransferase complex dimerization subunit type 1 TsaB [Erysipelotrichaceae bacterium OttesenSCG-928-M19]|nr:tRNA (adenosine(37)-N6)-threonylcarbamoyltransferase complex dimerization subunit type 1 TsaB [Erysipelotrichaceae bacterium OttesenSCG-928-M19]
MNLYIDTSSSYLIFSLFDKKVKDYHLIETNKNQSEIFIESLNTFLNNNNITLKDINNFFFARGPGSFTGIRVGLTFAKALKSSGYNNIYTISSLEVLMNDFSYSQAIIDARGQKYYYQEVKNEVFSQPKIIETASITNLNDYCTYENSLTKIIENVVELVKIERYSSDIYSEYIKDAF